MVESMTSKLDTEEVEAVAVHNCKAAARERKDCPSEGKSRRGAARRSGIPKETVGAAESKELNVRGLRSDAKGRRAGCG
eukprot:565473-Pleurochrysis_carterae.AAC.4